MKPFSKPGCLALLSTMILVTNLATAAAGETAAPPNWKGSGSGTTAPDPEHPGVDRDQFAGRSSHVGNIAAAGCHVLNADLTFAGYATWQTADGDTLNVTYCGVVFFTGDADYPFGFVAELDADGGTGRFSGAEG